MSEDEKQILRLLERLAASPSDNRLWDTQDVANYLNMKKGPVSNTILPRPDFPGAIRIAGKGHPKWEPDEVKAWARQFKEKRTA